MVFLTYSMVNHRANDMFSQLSLYPSIREGGEKYLLITSFSFHRTAPGPLGASHLQLQDT